MDRTLSNLQRGYVEAALFSSTDESRDDGGAPLDKNYTVDDLTDEAIATMKADCDRFIHENPADLADAVLTYRAEKAEADGHAHAGRDFWLTRNGHGAGFWDGDLPAELGDRLTGAAKSFGEQDLYVGDDGRLHIL